MSHHQERVLGKRRGSGIDEGQYLASHDIGPTSPKPFSLFEESDSRILRGYCGARKFVILSHFPLEPKARAEERRCRGHAVTSALNAPTNVLATLMGKGPLNSVATKNKEKTVITAIKYSAPNRAMLFSFYNHPQPL